MASHILASLCQPVTRILEAAASKGLTHITPADQELHSAAKNAIPRVSQFFEKLSCQRLALSLFLGLWPQVLDYLRAAGNDPALVEACLKIVTCAPLPSLCLASTRLLPRLSAPLTLHRPAPSTPTSDPDPSTFTLEP